MSGDYTHVLVMGGIVDQRDHEKYSRCLDAVIEHEGISVDDIIGVGEKGTGGNPDLYVVHRQGITKVSERGLINKRIEVEQVAQIASIARIRIVTGLSLNAAEPQEGFKGTDVRITGHDTDGQVLFKIVWGLGGPEWVGPMIERQREQLFRLIVEAIERR